MKAYLYYICLFIVICFFIPYVIVIVTRLSSHKSEPVECGAQIIDFPVLSLFVFENTMIVRYVVFDIGDKRVKLLVSGKQWKELPQKNTKGILRFRGKVFLDFRQEEFTDSETM